MRSHARFLDISEAAETSLIDAARDVRPVSGLTHNFYRYPARFSPAFVRAAIESFSEPGDLILDPFMGGGTSLVEALVLGRHAIGIDISSLAVFVASVKTTLYEDEEFERLTSWIEHLPKIVNIRHHGARFEEYAKAGYYKHLDHATRWRLRKAIEQALASAIGLSSERLESFARCTVLKTAQWAMDGRKKLPPIPEFRAELVHNAQEMIAGGRALRVAARDHGIDTRVHCLNRSTVGLENELLFETLGAPRLIVTSPPYPGIHVLYHRWQVDGRKEAPAPFWIASKLDGAGSSYYTMGDRQFPDLRTYFDNLRATMTSVAAVCDQDTIVIQMVAFADPSWQLPIYLEVMKEAGMSEAFLPALRRERDGRLWRTVPNRRWYSDQRGKTPGSQEVVLIHRSKAGLSLSRLRGRRTDRPPTDPPVRARLARA